jgi:uncharacterized protein YmfQ (DUF2313 family)
VSGDRHIRRSGEEYAAAFAALLPTGPAWPREPDTVLQTVVRGLAEIWGDPVDARAADLLERESDPRATLELLPDWERNWGLPDACVAEPLTIADRQVALVQKMTLLGAQSRAFFIGVAATLGYGITVTEFAPWMFGVSECGPTDDGAGHARWEIGPPEIRFYWTVHVNALRLTWWRFGQAEFGIDPHLRISLATDLECLIRRWKPAHTEIVFDYAPLAEQDYQNPDVFPYFPMMTG